MISESLNLRSFLGLQIKGNGATILNILPQLQCSGAFGQQRLEKKAQSGRIFMI